jgi:hypothetical protein
LESYGYEVVGVAADAGEALTLTGELGTDVMLLGGGVATRSTRTISMAGLSPAGSRPWRLLP